MVINTIHFKKLDKTIDILIKIKAILLNIPHICPIFHFSSYNWA